ncbi:aspartyl-phosphate phosphatase Spo0E family protein [Priestia megaterium]|uniref:aspartyl-phosphate phosphatase Spo0E family protein n=1 Tax=Priestia megaterium TaxID=1404 RepID=UPI001C244BEB|nr:aspartyl-phosphate phosphatase Spo0E family protein [Priestia megaterium]MBU8590390.1 aspartyl-phosphate phosphatase Spo0E family protein [Priestia megaterium]
MLTKVSELSQRIYLSECIINKRRELVDLGMNYGLLNKKTIQCSQDLDQLINLYMQSSKKTEYKFYYILYCS